MAQITVSWTASADTGHTGYYVCWDTSSHAGATGALVRALCAQGIDGIVVAATGNGAVHRELQDALVVAQSAGVVVLCTPRSGVGRAHPQAIDRLPMVDGLTPAKARVELMLRLMERAGA